jgi:hypothetical protein
MTEKFLLFCKSEYLKAKPEAVMMRQLAAEFQLVKNKSVKKSLLHAF